MNNQEQHYPKILIVGQPFNNCSGGGITLTNLFKGWEREKIAVAFAPWGDSSISSEICNTYYIIGNEEHIWKFPFNLFKQPFPSSGLLKETGIQKDSIDYHKKGLNHLLASKVFNPILNWLGLYHYASKIVISLRFQEWIKSFRPDTIYLQISSLEEINFAIQLIDYLKIPSTIHMMDDWPTTLSLSGPLRRFWQKRIDSEFKKLLNKVDLRLGISDSMYTEYSYRYNKEFIPFHNPVDSKIWISYEKLRSRLNKNNISILYSGRIGKGISDSLLDIASAIDSMGHEEFKIGLHIQTTTKDSNLLEMLRKHKCVVINPIVEYDKIPEVFSNADILLLANDFDPEAIKFLRLSMPTKASEYMISGTPILVYSPSETAVYKFFSQNKCGYCLTSQCQEEITKAIRFLVGNKEYCDTISRNAIVIAREKFDSEKVRNKFQSLIIGTFQQQHDKLSSSGITGNQALLNPPHKYNQSFPKEAFNM